MKGCREIFRISTIFKIPQDMIHGLIDCLLTSSDCDDNDRPQTTEIHPTQACDLCPIGCYSPIWLLLVGSGRLPGSSSLTVVDWSTGVIWVWMDL